MTTNKEELQTQMDRLLAEAKSLEEKIKAIPDTPPVKFGNPFLAVRNLKPRDAAYCVNNAGYGAIVEEGKLCVWDRSRAKLGQLFVDEATAKRRIEQLEIIQGLREIQGPIDFIAEEGFIIIYLSPSSDGKPTVISTGNCKALYPYPDYLIFPNRTAARAAIDKYQAVLYKLHTAYLQHGVNVYA